MHKKGGTYVVRNGKRVAVAQRDRAALFEKKSEQVIEDPSNGSVSSVTSNRKSNKRGKS